MRFRSQRDSLREFKRELILWRSTLTLRHLNNRIKRLARQKPRPHYGEYNINLDLEEFRKALRDRQEKRRR